MSMVDKLSVASLAILLLAGCPPKQPAGSPVDQPVDAGVDQAAGEDGASSPVAEPPEQRVQGLLSEAEEAVQAREPARLQPILEEMQGLARQFPDVAALHYDIGVVYEALNDRLNARKAYLRATDLDPSLAKAWLNLGALAEESGDLERAWRAYEAGRSHAPDDPDLVVGQIGVLRKQGRTEEAIALARQALGQNANNIGAYNNLGLVYLDQGNVDLANFIYQKALNSIEGADSNAYLHCNLGRVYKAMDKEYLAQQEFDRALQLDPELVAAMLFLGDARLDNHDWEGAAELLERARDLEPDNPAILVNLGIAYRGLGRFEEAAALYKRALELDPGNPDPYLNLAVLQGDHMRAYDAALASVDAYLAAGGTRTELAAQWRADLEKSREKYERELERKRRRAEREKQREEEARLAAEHEARQAAIRAAAEAALGQACPAEGCPELTVCNRAGVCAEPGSPGTAGMGDACSSDDDCVAGLGCGADAVCVEQAAPGAAEETEAAPGAAEETEAA
ncbi:MAG: tetratricopeptide repeat protein, partial [Deltaproteobacteria bacterium]